MFWGAVLIIGVRGYARIYARRLVADGEESSGELSFDWANLFRVFAVFPGACTDLGQLAGKS